MMKPIIDRLAIINDFLWLRVYWVCVGYYILKKDT